MPENTDNTPRVAIVVRTKDRPLLLDRALRSITSQTMDDFMIIIVNDGGDKIVLENLLKKHVGAIKGRLKVMNNRTSVGMQAASNMAIKASKSEYIAIHDDDDSWDPRFLEKTTDRLDATDGKGVIVTTDIVVEEIDGNKIKTIHKARLYPQLRAISLFRMAAENYATPITFLYRRSVLKKIGYYNESLGGVGDWDFGLRFLMSYDIEFLSTKNALAFYHHRPKATGIDINSVYTDNHKALETIIANHYLREDLAIGKLGLGFIMSLQRQHKEDKHELEENFKQLREEILRQAHKREGELNQEIGRLSSKIARIEPLTLKDIPLRKRITRSIYGLTVDWIRYKK